ncbi:MAG: 1,4-dihydroxy-2-naphthoate polyprenyltransferase [Acidobacteriota bacterium]
MIEQRPSPAAVRPGSPSAWLLAVRPATLSAAVVPVAIGAACSHLAGRVVALPMLVTLIGALCIQIGTNFVNDLADFERGADTEDRMGPIRTAQAGLLSPRQLRIGIVVAFACATAAGVYLTALVGWPIVVIGVASLLSAVAYTAGPFPLGYHGLGDVFVMLFFGFVAVCGTAYVNLETVPTSAWWASLVPGALATNLLVVNNVRDRVGDAEAGKRTLVVRFGRRFGELEYLLLVFVAYAVPALLVMLRLASPWALLPLLTLPLAGRLVQAVRIRDGRALNPVLGGTARLMVLHGILFAMGLAAGG